MDRIGRIESPAAPLMRANVDTDVITPMNRMTARSDKPLAYYAFEPMRYIGGDGDRGDPDPSFPLNDPAFSAARILLCGENFGCGSSRETAPAAIAALGIRCLIGSSFGDIFRNNCFQQGLLVITLPPEHVDLLAEQAAGGRELIVDLPAQRITAPDNSIYPFEINALRKKSLMEGLDDVALTLSLEDEIARWQSRDREARPWVYAAGPRQAD